MPPTRRAGPTNSSPTSDAVSIRLGQRRPNPVPPMSDAVVGGVLTFGAFDIVVFAAIVYLVTKLVRRVTGAPTERPKIA